MADVRTVSLGTGEHTVSFFNSELNLAPPLQASSDCKISADLDAGKVAFSCAQSNLLTFELKGSTCSILLRNSAVTMEPDRCEALYVGVKHAVMLNEGERWASGVLGDIWRMGLIDFGWDALLHVRDPLSNAFQGDHR